MLKASAIQRQSDGKIWVGKRHGDVFTIIISEEGKEALDTDEWIQGFITDEGQFVDRRQGFIIALQCKQFLEPEKSIPILISEELW